MLNIVRNRIPRETRLRIRRRIFEPILSLARRTADSDEWVRATLLEREELSPELVIRAAQQGMFYCPDPRTDEPAWHDPELRGVLPIEGYHVSKSLKRLVRKPCFELRVDHDFGAVIRACAERPGSWITPHVIGVYEELHEMGVAHSVETWQDGRLVGGLYAIAIASFFSGESQFHRVRDAGKIAMANTLRLLEERRFLLHDIQWPTDFMSQFGCTSLSRDEYLRRLARALVTPATFGPVTGKEQTPNHESRETTAVST